MTVLIANKIPPKIRGCLKTWFIEPKTGVFVSSINNNLAQKIIEFLSFQCKKSGEFILIQSSDEGLGYKIVRIGNKEKKMYELCGLNLF